MWCRMTATKKFAKDDRKFWNVVVVAEKFPRHQSRFRIEIDDEERRKQKLEHIVDLVLIPQCTSAQREFSIGRYSLLEESN